MFVTRIGYGSALVLSVFGQAKSAQIILSSAMPNAAAMIAWLHYGCHCLVMQPDLPMNVFAQPEHSKLKYW
jgi:hypothetical protein